ncbi:MAG: hypothetical protein CL670_16735 [Balneola sp.]|nr:hypothetical protein [Balneola sp.]MBE80809.1 hypothetical protein [Balneola sp.]
MAFITVIPRRIPGSGFLKRKVVELKIQIPACAGMTGDLARYWLDKSNRHSEDTSEKSFSILITITTLTKNQ